MTTSAPHLPVNVTLAIDDEPVHQPPSVPLTIAFAISFVPALGILGAAYAGWDLWSSSRQKISAHGLAYAAIALQLLYTILALTLYLVVFQLPLRDSASLSNPSVQAGQKLLLAMKSNDQAAATALLDDTLVGSVTSALSEYQATIQYNPQNISAENIQAARYQSKDLEKYSGQAASVQIWRVSSNQATNHYFILTLAQTAQGEWRTVGLLGLDAGGDQTARTIARQVRNNTFGE